MYCAMIVKFTIIALILAFHEAFSFIMHRSHFITKSDLKCLDSDPIDSNREDAIVINTDNKNPELSNGFQILRQINKWACVKSCGACCKLGPLDSRPDLETYLTPEEYKLYVSMIGGDNWCKNFDQVNRMCTIYETRPEFCKVDPKKYKKMFQIEEEELDDFCSFCCQEQIEDVYGGDSIEMERFENAIESLQ